VRGDGVDDGESVMPDDATELTHPDTGLVPPGRFYGESEDNLLLKAGSPTPYLGESPAYTRSPFADQPDTTSNGGWESEYDRKEAGGSPTEPSKEMIVKEAPNAVEEVPSTCSQRIWLWVVMATTWWIPEVCLRRVGRMKRPDIRLAWRESSPFLCSSSS
jgi:chitin synthase